MRAVVLYVAMSLDGYIARNDGGLDFLGGDAPDGSSDELMAGYTEFLQTVTTLIMGRTTYDQVLGFGEWPYHDKQSLVYTRRTAPADDRVTFVNDEPTDLVARLRAESGGTIWLLGGADLARQFDAADLIDEWRITVIPYLLGDGIRLFDRVARERGLRLLNTRAIAGTVELHYTRR